jgi:hypothetical protein
VNLAALYTFRVLLPLFLNHPTCVQASTLKTELIATGWAPSMAGDMAQCMELKFYEMTDQIKAPGADCVCCTGKLCGALCCA